MEGRQDGWAWMRLGDLIRAELEKRGWTQQQLADEAGISQVTVSKIVNGHQRGRIPRSVPAIERALGWPAGTARVLLDGGVLAWQQALQTIDPDSFAPTVPRSGKATASAIAALTRNLQGARIAIDQMPLSEEDRQRFIAHLDALETDVIETLDRGYGRAG